MTGRSSYAVGVFNGPDALVRAARFLKARGIGGVDCHTPYPLDELAEIMDVRDWPLPMLAALGAVAGAVVSLAIQAYTHLDYPLNVGGRPVLSWTAFALPALQFAALTAVLVTVLGMLWANGLPRLHHPLFSLGAFDRVTDDAFLISVDIGRAKLGTKRVERMLREAGAHTVWLGDDGDPQ